MTRPRLVVLASGNGSNLQALIDAVDKGHINGQIVAVVSDRPESRALTRATDAGILAAPLPIAEGEHRDDYDRRLADLLSERMALMPPEDFEMTLRTAMEEDEWQLIAVGAALGLAVGIFQYKVMFAGVV